MHDHIRHIASSRATSRGFRTTPNDHSSSPHRSWPRLVFALLAILSAPPTVARCLAAQEPIDPFTLPDIVVTATRTPLARDVLPMPVTILTGEALRERGIRTVADALRLVPGVAVMRAGAEGGQTSLFMRGGESDYMKVLVDGVPVNEAGGAIDIADLSTDQVERIEVVRGPVSVLYGSDAVSGVIQIFTLRGRGGPRLEATALGGRGERRHEDGRYSTMDSDLTLAGQAGGLSYSLGAGRSWSAGLYPVNNERTLHTASARLAWSAADGVTEISLSTRFTSSETGFPTDGAGNLVDENAVIDRRLWTTSVEAVRRLGSRVESRLQIGIAARSQVALDEPDHEGDTLGVFASRLDSELTRRFADLRISAELPLGTLTLGGGPELAGGSTRYESRSEWGPLSAEAEYDRSNSAAYVQLVAEPVPGLHFAGGGRVDHNEAFGRFDTYRIGLSWGVRSGTRLRGAAGRAFREPAFSENFGSGFGDVGNEGLTPERTRSWEVGAEHSFGLLVLSATWFDQQFRDLIQFTFTTADPGDPNYFNVGAAKAEGLELSAEAARGRMALSGSYTQLWTRVLDPGLATDGTFVTGQPLLRRPGRSGSVSGRFALDGGVLSLTLSATGGREDLDFGEGFPAPRVTLPAYATVDLSGEHEIFPSRGPEARLLLRVENLLDSDHEAIAGFAAPGRLVRLGMKVGFGG